MVKGVENPEYGLRPQSGPLLGEEGGDLREVRPGGIKPPFDIPGLVDFDLMDDSDRPAAPEFLVGVFSTEAEIAIGYGATRRKVKKNVMVFVKEVKEGVIQIQALNKNFVPSGKVRNITKARLLEEYIPEPEMYLGKVKPAMEDLDGLVLKADEHRQREEYMSSEFEYKNALRIDEGHIRATFGLGLTYLDLGQKDKADIVFKRLISLDGAYRKKHKHLFNEFGIKLRKSGMLLQALKYYARALKLSRRDEHLLFNLARTLFDMGKLKAALRYAKDALELNPDFSEARRFQAFLHKKLTPKKNYQVD